MKDSSKPLGYYYLASPFTNYEQGEELAYRHICKIAAIFIKNDILVYSPIAHSYSIALAGNMKKDFVTWGKLNSAMLIKSKGLIIAQMPGWKNSQGIADEIKMAKENGLTIFMINPNYIKDTMPDIIALINHE